MKKIIKILQSNVEPLIIEDQDDTELNEYIKNISNLLSSTNITILETSDSSHVIKPHKIISISVTEEGRPKRKYTKKTEVKTPKKEDPKKETIQEDIITDE